MMKEHIIFDVDIFHDEPTISSKKKYYVNPWQLYVQPVYLSDKSNRNVAAASLFLYPERAAKGELSEYRNRVSEYLSGIKRSLDFVSLRKEWLYRIYVDYSIIQGYKFHHDKEIRLIAALMLQTLQTYTQRYSNVIEIIAVRSLQTASTFIASLWRFLPLFDENVDKLLCSEADNPFNSLYLHFADTFWKGDDKYMMISPDTYGPPHCLIRVAMDIESDSANRCFIAQNWGGRRMHKERTIEDPALFTMLLNALDDKDAISMWSNALNLLTMKQAIIKAISDHIDIKEILYAKTWDALKKRMIDSIQSACRDNKLFKQGIDPVILQLASKNRKVAGFIAVMMFPSLIQPHVAVTRHVKQYYVNTFMVPTVLKKGYGIDEWLLHLLYDEVSKQNGVSLIRSNSPEFGITIGQSSWLQSADAGNTLKLFTDLVKESDLPFGEFVARTIFFLKAISPEKNSTVFHIFKKLKNDYFQRLYLLSQDSFVSANIDYNMAYKLMDSLYYNEGFERQAQKKGVFINDIKKFDAWTKANNILYDHKAKRFSYSNKHGFNVVKNVFFKGLFCDVKFMHIFKFCDDVTAQLIPW